MNETRTVADPFLCKNVEVSSRLVDRLRGRYACGPVTPSGEPEFGWRQFETAPIQHEAADRIEQLEAAIVYADKQLRGYGQIDPVMRKALANIRADAG